jgi:hypothetical protein
VKKVRSEKAAGACNKDHSVLWQSVWKMVDLKVK